jgi:hypothetical protein
VSLGPPSSAHTSSSMYVHHMAHIRIPPTDMHHNLGTKLGNDWEPSERVEGIFMNVAAMCLGVHTEDRRDGDTVLKSLGKLG